MKQITKVLILIMALCLSSLGQAADLSKALIEGAKKEGKLVWWGTDSPPIANKVIAAFTKKYPFIKVDYTKGIGTDFGDRIMMEADSGIGTVDFVNGASSHLNKMLERGLLKNIGDMPFMKLWPNGAKDPKGYWFGMTPTYWILAYNSKLISAAEVPKSYDEITNPKWKGQFAIEERPDHWFLGLWLAWGPEKATRTLEKVIANKPFLGKGYSATGELLMAGQFKFTIPLQDYKIVQFREKKAPIDWVPLHPTEIDGQPAQIMKKAPNPHTAELFIRWLTSREGQESYCKASAKASFHPDLRAIAPLPIPKDLQVVYHTPESYKLLGPGGPVAETYNRLVHGM